MATVTAVETNKPVVKSITLKLAPWEAMDMLTFIEAWFQKYGYGSQKPQNHSLHKTLTAGLAGETTHDF